MPGWKRKMQVKQKSITACAMPSLVVSAIGENRFRYILKMDLPYLIKEEELPLVLPEIDKYLPTETGEPPLGRAEDWSYEDHYEYELSTMPGWAGSSWYWYRYMDAHNKHEFAAKKRSTTGKMWISILAEQNMLQDTCCTAVSGTSF